MKFQRMKDKFLDWGVTDGTTALGIQGSGLNPSTTVNPQTSECLGDPKATLCLWPFSLVRTAVSRQGQTGEKAVSDALPCLSSRICDAATIHCLLEQELAHAVNACSHALNKANPRFPEVRS